MYPGAIELAAKARYDAMVAEGQHQQFAALHCVAAIGVWPVPTSVPQRFASLLLRAARRVRGMGAFTTGGQPAVTAARSAAAS